MIDGIAVGINVYWHEMCFVNAGTRLGANLLLSFDFESH